VARGRQRAQTPVFRPWMPPACWSVVVASSLMAPPARADAGDARDLFDRARELRLRGDCASALPLFHRAYDAYPTGLGSLRNVAECEEMLGHFGSARRAWLELQHALITNRASKYDGWEQDAVEAAARLAPKLATLTIEVRAVTESGKPADATGIDVSFNGERVSPDDIGRPLDRDPGRYVVVAAGPASSVAEERVVVLGPGESKRVELRVVVPGPADRDRATSRVTTERTAAWIAAGVGAASFVGAAIAALERRSALDDLTTECNSTTECPAARNNTAQSARLQAIEDRGHAAATWVNVLAVVGVLGLSSGVVLYAIGRSRPSQAALFVSPAGLAVVGSY
jgi:hypothetical protein